MPLEADTTQAQPEAHVVAGEPEQEKRRQRRNLTARRWKREQTVLRRVNELAVLHETQVYLVIQHDGEERKQIYHSQPDKRWPPPFDEIMKFDYPVPQVRTPQTMGPVKDRSHDAPIHEKEDDEDGHDVVNDGSLTKWRPRILETQVTGMAPVQGAQLVTREDNNEDGWGRGAPTMEPVDGSKPVQVFKHGGDEMEYEELHLGHRSPSPQRPSDIQAYSATACGPARDRGQPPSTLSPSNTTCKTPTAQRGGALRGRVQKAETRGQGRSRRGGRRRCRP